MIPVNLNEPHVLKNCALKILGFWEKNEFKVNHRSQDTQMEVEL